LSVNVDDGCLMLWGTDSRVAGENASAGHPLASRKHSVDLRLATNNSRVLSNAPAVRATIAAMLMSPQPLPVRSERNLGADFGSGIAASRGTARGRVASMRPRMVRMGFLKGSKPRRRVLGHTARAAVESSVVFGASVTGTNCKELEALKKDRRQDGKSRTRALMLAPVPRLDPTYRATWLPVKADVHASWHLWMPFGALDSGLREAHRHLSTLQHPWRAGITATSATSWFWLDGADVNPSDFCPNTIQELVIRAVELSPGSPAMLLVISD
ncbi:unnamed protein product, partial [Prorocentrum cordatum]